MSKSAVFIDSIQKEFKPQSRKSHNSYFGTDNEEGGESESEWAHPGISMRRIEETINEAIDESNKGIYSKIQELNLTMRNDVLNVINEIKDKTLNGLTNAINEIKQQIKEDKKLLMSMILDHK